MNLLMVKKDIDEIFKYVGGKISIKNLNYRKYLQLSTEDKKDILKTLSVTLRCSWMEQNKEFQKAKYNVTKAFHRNIEDGKSFLKIAYIVNEKNKKFKEIQKSNKARFKDKKVLKMKNTKISVQEKKIIKNIKENKSYIFSSVVSMVGLNAAGTLLMLALKHPIPLLANAVINPYVYGIIFASMTAYTIGKTIGVVVSNNNIKRLQRKLKRLGNVDYVFRDFEAIDDIDKTIEKRTVRPEIKKDGPDKRLITASKRAKYESQLPSRTQTSFTSENLLTKPSNEKYNIEDSYTVEKTIDDTKDIRKPVRESNNVASRYNPYTDYPETVKTPVFYKKDEREGKILTFPNSKNNQIVTGDSGINKAANNNPAKKILIIPETARGYSSTNQSVSKESMLYQQLSEREKELCIKIQNLKENISLVENKAKNTRVSTQKSHIELYNRNVDSSYVDYYAQRRKLKKELAILEAEYQVCVMSLNSLDHQTVNSNSYCKEYMKKYIA